MFAPSHYYRLQSENRTVGQILVKANAGCAVAQKDQAKIAGQFQEPISVFLIHGYLRYYGDGTFVEVGRFGQSRQGLRRGRLHIKRSDEIKRQWTADTQVITH